MPEDSTPPSNTPRRHRPRLTELAKETTEEDLWVLDDEDDHAAPAPAPEPEKEAESVESTPAPVEPAPAETPASKAIEEEVAETEVEPTPEQESPTASPASEESTTAASSPEPEPARQEPVATPKPSQPVMTKPDRKEWIGLGVLGAVFLAVAIWWITGLFSSVTTTRMGEDEPEFPIEGQFIEAKSAVSFWRKPIRDGENADVARSEVVYLPVAVVTLKGTGDGVLRAIFRDDEGSFVGDTITRSFTAGHFDDSGSPTVEFPATSGFQEHSDFNAYRVGGNRWTVEVLEGPSANAQGSEFKLLFKAPISSLRR